MGEIKINKGYEMNWLEMLSFVGFRVVVGVMRWWKVGKRDRGWEEGYFVGGG